MTGIRRWAMVVAAVAVMLACGQASAGEKYALLCGCVEYDNGPNLKPNDLPTTLYDVVAMYEMLTGRYGFKPENIRVLISPPEKWPLKPAAYGPATITNIAEQFSTWFAKAGPDDLIFFGYSGHGTFVHYKGNGVEVHEEALLGTDYGWIDPPQVLTFSQIRWMHSKLHDGQSVFVIDACHSGGGALAPAEGMSPFGPPPPVRFNPADDDTRPLLKIKAGGTEAGMQPTVGAADMEALSVRWRRGKKA